MEILFLCVVIFLFLLAVFDLSVGVSNDAVNFLNSAIGSRAASFKRVLIVASIGVFIGAAMSNGMMDIARHGIFRPEHFSFYDLICIFMAVMVTDIILLDIFNSLGMPTSTTVSMVFELLGATFVVALIKMAGGIDLGFNDLLNTEKALSVILGIFLSVAIAFFFGTVVQFLSRMIFSFNYRSNLKWKIGIFGGICATAIVYFLLIKGAKDLTFMTPEVKGWIKAHTGLIILCCFGFFTILMQLLHICKVNVLKIIVLMGTFSLAMAFAGNDLVNFIGVPLSGLASYQDYIANGGGDAHGFLMDSLNGPANTPIYFLIGAGVIMVVSLATSKKAKNVTKTEIGLGSQQGGDEMFGSSRISRRLVRWTLSFLNLVRGITPPRVRRWFNRRFNVDETIMDQGASFDLIRGSVNLVLAGALIAFGTSLKLPLSTTFVTFMVAMGTSLADRAWGRESAVFRITGVPVYLAFLFGGIVLATAPAPSLSIVNELKTNGPVTRTLMPMAALDDLVGATVFFVVVALVSAQISSVGIPVAGILVLVFLPVPLGGAKGFWAGCRMCRARTPAPGLWYHAGPACSHRRTGRAGKCASAGSCAELHAAGHVLFRGICQLYSRRPSGKHHACDESRHRGGADCGHFEPGCAAGLSSDFRRGDLYCRVHSGAGCGQVQRGLSGGRRDRRAQNRAQFSGLCPAAALRRVAGIHRYRGIRSERSRPRVRFHPAGTIAAAAVINEVIAVFIAVRRSWDVWSGIPVHLQVFWQMSAIVVMYWQERPLHRTF